MIDEEKIVTREEMNRALAELKARIIAEVELRLRQQSREMK